MTTHTSTAQRSSKYPTTIGIDVGGTGMKGGLVRLGSGPKAGTLRGERFRIPTPQPAMPEPVAATLAAITAELDRLVPTVATTPPAGWQPGQQGAAGAPAAPGARPATTAPTTPAPRPQGR